MQAFYNDSDPFKCEVLRQAIKAGAIAPGVVDERSIIDLRASDLAGYSQCHFFAGGGFWSLALRQAGWPDDRPIFTGSCPCPSFSAAGKGEGFADPRHLWPEWFRLIRECRPATVIGEQVDSAIGYGWLDTLAMDLEAEGYAFAAAVLGAHSAGAPHIRQRIYFVAELADSKWRRREQRDQGERGVSIAGADLDAGFVEHTQERGCGIGGDAAQPGNGGHADGAEQFGVLVHTSGTGCEGIEPQSLEGTRRWDEGRTITESSKALGGLANASGGQLPFAFGGPDQRNGTGSDGADDPGAPERSRANHSFWARADWIGCRDGKFRPVPGTVKSGALGLVDGNSADLGYFLLPGGGEYAFSPLIEKGKARVGRLRLYGDAICVPVAEAFIKAYMETVKDRE